MSMLWSDQLRPWMPWLITTVSLGYVAYIHYRIRQLKAKPVLKPINPYIDKHKQKVKHVFKGEQLEKEVDISDNKSDLKTNATEGEPEDDRPRGRRSAYSYFVSECADKESNSLCQSSEDRIIFAEFAKKCAKNWKKLTEEEKQCFHRLSETDKKRYENEMKIYRKQSRKSFKSKAKAKLCSKAVPEDISEDNLLEMAFDMFAGEEMPIVRDQRPSIDDNNEEILTELLKRWEKSDPEFKNQYLDRIRLESTAFNRSFNTSIKDDEELSDADGEAVDDNRCDDNDCCGSDQELDPEVGANDDCVHSKSSKV